MLLSALALKNPCKKLVTNPFLWIKQGKIKEINSFAQLSENAKADPEKIHFPGILYPGLINAHTHLELSHLSFLSYPGSFTKWIQKLLLAKEKFPITEDSFTNGFNLSLQSGVTCVGEHLSLDSPWEAWLKSPLRARIFGEVLGVVPEVAQTLYEAAKSIQKNFEKINTVTFTPSPHSVHAVHPDCLADLLSKNNEVLSLHIAESEDEANYFAKNSGPLEELIASRGQPLHRNGKSAMEEINKNWRSNLLLVHGNYFNQLDLKKIKIAGNVLVHCPFSHAYFGHRPFPLKACLEAGIPLALGTDSLASASTLNFLEVMRQMKKNFAFLSEEEIFKMATINGAKALGWSGQVGELIPGAFADLFGIKTQETNDSKSLEILFKSKKVDWVMVGGTLRL